MSDQPDEWWTNAGGAQPAPPPPAEPAPAPARTPQVDPDSTVVVPARHPGAPPVDPGHGGTPAQYAPQGPPPGSQPPQYGGQPPQQSQPQQGQPQQPYANAPQQGAPAFGGPQFVQHNAPTSRYRAPVGSIMMLVGAAVAILGTFLPWITFGGGSVNGYETYLVGDRADSVAWANPGAYVAGAMIIVAIASILVLAAGRRVATWIIALLAAALGGLTAFAGFGAVGSVLNNQFNSSGINIGFGVILCLVGAVVSGIGAIIVAAKSS